MSLIIEALRRARDDAVRRQVASRGLPLAPIPRLRGRSRWLTLALVPLTAALVVCILLLFDLYSRLPQPPATLEGSRQGIGLSGSPAASSAPSPLPSPSAEAAAASGFSVEPLARDEHPVAPQSSQTPGAASPLVGTSANNAAAPPVVVPGRSRSVVAESPPKLPESGGTLESREFVGQAQLRDGQLVDLGGIAWSESEPFALLNGNVVGVGELIRTYRITEIKQDQVVLEEGDDRIVLYLK